LVIDGIQELLGKQVHMIYEIWLRMGGGGMEYGWLTIFHSPHRVLTKNSV
jgi:hypothetical protein